MKQRILITGATGNIGQELIRALKARGIEFSVMTSKAGQALEGLPTVVGDFAKPESLKQAFAGFDTLFLLLPLVPELPEFGRNAIEAAKAAGIRHVVRSSGAGADPGSPFAIARVHGEVDRLLQESGLAWTILRPTSFMQNLLTYYCDQIKGGTFYAPQGDGAVALIDVRDIAESAAAILAEPNKHAGRAYTLTGSEALTNDQQMALVSSVTGEEKRYVDIPDDAAREAMAGHGMPTPVIEWLMSLNAVIKAGYAAGTTDDVQTLAGHPPRRFADFVKENAAAWR
ncbi:MAG: SDR family oxidoreductase [Betaproteobacteria bacterium]